VGVKSLGEGIVGIRSVFFLWTRCCAAKLTAVPAANTSPSSPIKQVKLSHYSSLCYIRFILYCNSVSYVILIKLNDITSSFILNYACLKIITRHLCHCHSNELTDETYKHISVTKCKRSCNIKKIHTKRSMYN